MKIISKSLSLLKSKPDLLEGSISKNLFILALPIMLAHLLQTAYNLVDTFWLGKVGEYQLEAPGVVWPMMFLFITLASGLGIAGTTLVSQYTGAGNEDKANYYAAQTVIFVFFAACIISIIGTVFSEDLLKLLNTPPEVLPNARIYMRIVFAGIPFIFFIFIFQAIMRGWGDTVTPLILSGGAVILNLILDPFLILGIGPFPRLETAGAAIATVFSRGLASIIAIYLMFSGKVGVKLKFVNLNPSWSSFKKIISIGFPAAIGQSSTGLAFTVMIAIVNHFETAVLGAYVIGMRVISFCLMPALGLGMATGAMVGQNIGAGNIHRAKKVTYAGIGLSTAILFVMGALAFGFSEYIVKIFIDKPSVVVEGARLIRIVVFSMIFVGVSMSVRGTFQGSGHTIPSMIFTLVRLWVLRVPLSYILGITLAIGANGVWWGMSISNVIGALVAYIFFLSGSWKKKAIIHRE
ncbi:MATE family efflux transporter [bacterium]|nr:MATE family efflux transporter [bacterium]